MECDELEIPNGEKDVRVWEYAYMLLLRGMKSDKPVKGADNGDSNAVAEVKRGGGGYWEDEAEGITPRRGSGRSSCGPK